MDAAAKSSVFDSTVDMLQLLNDEELEAIQSVARVFIMNPQVQRPYRHLTEDEMISRVDLALTHVWAGLYEDAEAVEAEIAAEFDL